MPHCAPEKIHPVWSSILLSGMVFFLAGTCLGQTPPSRLSIKLFTEADGLSANSVTGVIKDQNGFWWVGTTNGLNRFDGKEFKVYHEIYADTASLPGSTMMDMAIDSMNRLWLATSSGLCWLDLNTNRIHRISHPSLDDDMISSLLVDQAGQIWVGKWDSVYHIRANGSFAEAYQIRLPGENKYLNFSNRIIQYNDSILLTCGSRYITSINACSHQVQRIFFHDSGPIMSIDLFEPGKIFFSTYRSGAFVLDMKHLKVVDTLSLLPVAGNSNRLTGYWPLLTGKGPGDHYWTGGLNGLKWIRRNPLQCEAIYDIRSGNPTFDECPIVYGMSMDGAGHLWLATITGLGIVDLKKPLFRKCGITGIISICHANDPREYYWVVTEQEGIVLMDANTLLPQLYFPLPPPYLPKEERIEAQYQDKDGGIWIGTTGSNLFRFDIKERNFQCYRPHREIPNFQYSITSISQTSDGNMWFTSNAGLCRFKPTDGSFRQFYYPDSTNLPGTPGLGFFAMTIDKKDRIWLCGDIEHLIEFNQVTEQFNNVPILNFAGEVVAQPRSNTPVESEGGELWLATGSGVYRFDERSHTFHSVNLGITSNRVDGLYCRSTTQLWGVYERNLFMYDLANKALHQFQPGGLLFKENAYEVKSIANTSFLYSLHHGGTAYLFDPESLRPEEIRDPIRLTEFRLLKNDSLLQPQEVQALKLPYGQNAIRLSFQLLDYDFVSSSRYYIKLEGADDDWTPNGSNNSVIYSNLREGHYVFWVKANKYSGNWTAPYKLAEFTIATPFARSPLFMILLVVTVGLILYGIYRYRVENLKKVFMVRSKISSDLHDDIGSSLTSIRVYSDLAKRRSADEDLTGILDKIEGNAGDIIQSMSDIVWTINPKYDDFTFVVQRMENFASGFLSLKDIQYTLRKSNGVENIRLAMEKRKSIFLIFKEAIHNAAKYSGCRNVVIELSQEGKFLEMAISDDGTGFDREQNQSGNGLNNMKERAREVGGVFRIQSTRGTGTQIQVIIPI